MWPEREAPPLLQSIGDYDLWQFKLPNTEANIALLCSYPYDFETWHDLMCASRAENSWYVYKRTGYALLRQHERNARETIEQQLGVTAQLLVGNGEHLDVPVINCPRHLTGAVSKIMLKDYAVCATYYHTAKGIKWSLRSAKDTFDVNVMAGVYGGGGHVNAAGFVQPFASELYVPVPT